MKQRKFEEEKITMEMFAEMVKGEMEAYFGQAYRVMVETIPRNNGQAHTGLVIKDDRIKIAPAIHLDGYYERFQNGGCMAGLCLEIIRAYEETKMNMDFDTDAILSFAGAKKRICFKLVNAGLNAEFLEGAPHIPLHDLVVVFYVVVSMDCHGIATIMVDDRLREKWGMDVDELFRYAAANTQRLFPGEVVPMEELLRGWPAGTVGEKETRELSGLSGCGTGRIPLYVMSNTEKTNGAGVILYPDLLKDFAEKVRADVYILPASVHEVLLVPADSGIEPDALKDMVLEVNTAEVLPEEKLSDSVYYYSRKADRVEML